MRCTFKEGEDALYQIHRRIPRQLATEVFFQLRFELREIGCPCKKFLGDLKQAWIIRHAQKLRWTRLLASSSSD